MTQDKVDITTDTFTPPLWMRPTMVQTILASRRFRKKPALYIQQQAETMILQCSDGVRLKASYTPHPDSKGIFIIFHGWEGSQDSAYVLSSSRFVYEQGYSVFRLNYRDHGDTHALNEGLFNSFLFQEVWDGAAQGAALEPDKPAFLVGFSLGGNFALRVARTQKKTPVSNLAHIFAISPVIDPVASAPMVDQNILIKRYFYNKWTTSLKKKEAAFPGLYDFSPVYQHKTVMAMTDEFLKGWSDYKNRDDYFSSYGIRKDDLSDCEVRTSIIMGKDDPVLRADDLHDLNLSSCVSPIMLKYGGHNGFFGSVHGPTWYDEYIAEVLGKDH